MGKRCEGRKAKRLSLTAIVSLCVFTLLGGCGSGGDPDHGNSSYAIEHGETVHDCLLKIGGATFVQAPNRIPFFWRAKKSNGVIEAGSAYDPQQGLEIHLLVPKVGGAKRWMLWYSQPPSSSQSILEITSRWALWYKLPPSDPHKNDRFDKHLHRNYVVSVVRPAPRFRREARHCVKFPSTAG